MGASASAATTRIAKTALGNDMADTARVLDPEVPTMMCPKCGVEESDYDGFGVLFHTKQAYPETGCGFCSHPSRTGNGNGSMVCDTCGDVRHG